MALDPGQTVYPDGNEVTLESDGSGSAGDFVTINSSSQVTPVSATDDDIVGVLAEDSPPAGEDVGVKISGIVVANVGSAVSAGDVLEPDSATNGRAVANSSGFVRAVDEGGTATYTLSFRGAFALNDSGATFEGNSYGTNEAAVKLL